MSDTDPDVRVVVEMVRGVSGQVRGLRDLTKSQFRDVQRQLDAASELPRTVEYLRATVTNLKADVEDLKERGGSEDTYRRVHRPTLIVASLALIVATLSFVAFVIANLH